MWVFGLAGLVLAAAGSLAWAVRRFSIATRDSVELAAKLAVPHPQRAADWPELRLEQVVFDPEVESRALVLARWPAHPERRALLDLELDGRPGRASRLLAKWCDQDTSLSPTGVVEGEIVLRRRGTRVTVSAVVVRETSLARDEVRSYTRR